MKTMLVLTDNTIINCTDVQGSSRLCVFSLGRKVWIQGLGFRLNSSALRIPPNAGAGAAAAGAPAIRHGREGSRAGS